MANPNTPFGLRPVKYISGAPWTGGGNIYYIASNNVSAFYPGDPVCSSSDADANGIPGISIGVAGSAIRGVIWMAGSALSLSTAMGGGQVGGGPYINPNDLTKVSVPVTKASAYYALVIDDPNVIFECMEQYTGTAFTSAEVGLNANFVINTPATAVSLSATAIDNGTEATSSSLNLKLLGLSQKGNNAYGIGAVWQVLINNHELRAGITGV